MKSRGSCPSLLVALGKKIPPRRAQSISGRSPTALLGCLHPLRGVGFASKSVWSRVLLVVCDYRADGARNVDGAHAFYARVQRSQHLIVSRQYQFPE